MLESSMFTTSATARPLRIIVADADSSARLRCCKALDLLKASLPHNVIAECGASPSVLDAVTTGTDIVLVDIAMPKLDGIEVARRLLRTTKSPNVVFTSTQGQRAVEAFEVKALDYIYKPRQSARLLNALKRAKHTPDASIEGSKELARRYSSASERSRLTLVPVDDVLYLRADLKYISILTETKEYLMEESLARLEEEFPECFLRIHRNCLVRRNLVVSIERDRDKSGVERWVVTLTERQDWFSPIHSNRRTGGRLVA